MALDPNQLNDLDEWILDFLGEHEWATPNLLRLMHADDVNDAKSRQWFNDRLVRLEEHNHIARVHTDASERKLVNDPREIEQ